MPWIYDGKEREETVEWTEKDLHTEIEVQLLRYLKSRGMRPSDVKAVQAVVGGDHGDTVFQFGAAITAESHGIIGKDIPIMAHLAEARRWSKR